MKAKDTLTARKDLQAALLFARLELDTARNARRAADLAIALIQREAEEAKREAA